MWFQCKKIAVSNWDSVNAYKKIKEFMEFCYEIIKNNYDKVQVILYFYNPHSPQKNLI